jgi:Protein of unknown function (DUF3918)
MKRWKRMNKMITPLVAFGAGMVAYNLVQRNNLMSERQMKRMMRKVKRAMS